MLYEQVISFKIILHYIYHSRRPDSRGLFTTGLLVQFSGGMHGEHIHSIADCGFNDLGLGVWGGYGEPMGAAEAQDRHHF